MMQPRNEKHSTCFGKTARIIVTFSKALRGGVLNKYMEASAEAKLLYFISSQTPIKVLSDPRSDDTSAKTDRTQTSTKTLRCTKCHQEGEGEKPAFSHCHLETKAVHRAKAQHTGYLVPCHGPRDSDEKRLNRLKATSQVLGTVAIVVAAATMAAAVVTTATTVAMPTPATFATVAHFGAATIALGPAANSMLRFAEDGRINEPAPPLRCIVTKLEIERKDIQTPIIANAATRGVCQDCNGDVATADPCHLVWTCCGNRLDPTTTVIDSLNPTNMYGLRSPCKPACKQSCEPGSKGCIDECTNCGRTSNQEAAFKRTGCDGSEHVLADTIRGSSS